MLDRPLQRQPEAGYYRERKGQKSDAIAANGFQHEKMFVCGET